MSEKKDGDNGDVADEKGGKSKYNVVTLTGFEVGTMEEGFYVHNFAAEYDYESGMTICWIHTRTEVLTTMVSGARPWHLASRQCSHAHQGKR